MTKLIGTFASIVGTLGVVFALYYLVPQGLWLHLLLLCLSVQLVIMAVRSAIKSM